MKMLINSYKSVGEFTFGSSLADVKKQHGEPARLIEDNIMNNIVEQRNACELVYENNILVYVNCFKDSNPQIINGIDIFKESIEALKSMDSDFIEGKKYITFRNLGICVGGMLGKKIPEGKILIAFDKNHLDFFETFTEV